MLDYISSECFFNLVVYEIISLETQLDSVSMTAQGNGIST